MIQVIIVQGTSMPMPILRFFGGNGRDEHNVDQKWSKNSHIISPFSLAKIVIISLVTPVNYNICLTAFSTFSTSFWKLLILSLLDFVSAITSSMNFQRVVPAKYHKWIPLIAFYLIFIWWYVLWLTIRRYKYLYYFDFIMSLIFNFWT